MKTIYITLGSFAIMLIFSLFMFFLDIPAPSKTVVETHTLEIK